MRWIALAYSLPARAPSSRRVAVWRRVRQLGAVSPTGGLYLLPEGEESLEAFGWLAHEIEEGGGHAMVLHVERVAGNAEERLFALSREARDEDYREIAAEAAKALGQARRQTRKRPTLRAPLEKLYRRYAEVSRIDFWGAGEGPRAASVLAELEAAMANGDDTKGEQPLLDPASYRGRTWVTRRRPHVDRLACAWLIRRFIDPQATLRYGEPQPGELSFDLPGADFGHTGNRCTFETLVAAFGLDDPALRAMAGVVHEIDLRDGLSSAPEVAGIDCILRGWLAAGLSDEELERHGIALFEGLYRVFRQEASRPARKGRGKPRK